MIVAKDNPCSLNILGTKDRLTGEDIMDTIHQISKLLIIGLGIVIFSTANAFGYTPWQDNLSYNEELGEARIRVRREIRTIKVYPVTQKNCIFEQMEENPDSRTSTDYRQPHCASLRNQRVSASDNNDMPEHTKLTRIPANEYFKIRMIVSDQMSNRVGEEFGIQIIDAETKETQYLQGGWKPGDEKMSRAIRLKPGRYYWRCPVNPTPWYGLIAE